MIHNPVVGADGFMSEDMSPLAEHDLDPHLVEQLPTLPGTAVEFLRLCEDPTVGVKDVAAVAQRDPALLARIIQVANSPFYSPREPVSDVARASAILGLRSLKMIGVGFAILGDLWSTTSKSHALAGVIGASSMAGSAARSFSARVGTGRDEEALTAGLLSFLGELALLRCYPEAFNELWESEGHLPSAQAQREAMGADGVTVGVALLDRWKMPTSLRDGVLARRRSIDERLAPTPRVYEASLGFGTAIAELLTSGGAALERIRPAARRWGFDDDELLHYWGEFRLALRRTNQQMDLDVTSDLDAIVVEAKTEYLQSSVHASDELNRAQLEIEELRAENERLEGLSLQDPLTGIANRAAFNKFLRSSLASLQRVGGNVLVGVAMFDLDYFKQVNDSAGHLVGDELLKVMANAAHMSARQDELFARLGGDEFAMVMRPRSLQEMEAGIERVRGSMVAAAANTPGVPSATVTGGGALIRAVVGDLDSVETLLSTAADDALYSAKRGGRNNVHVTAVDGPGALSIVNG